MMPFYCGVGCVVFFIVLTTYAAEYNVLNQDVIYVERIKRNGKGYMRGQTQSQYLNFGKPEMEGKAEAAANESGSKSTVSGTHGMGQAQSQFSSGNCGECPGVSMYDYSLGAPDSLKLGRTGYQGQPSVGGVSILQPTIDQKRPGTLDRKFDVKPTGLDTGSRRIVPTIDRTQIPVSTLGIQQPLGVSTIPGTGYFVEPTPSHGAERVQPVPRVSTTGQREQAQPSSTMEQPSLGALLPHMGPQIGTSPTVAQPYLTDQRTQAQPSQGLFQPPTQPQIIGRQPLPQTYGRVPDQRTPVQLPTATGETVMPSQSFVQPTQPEIYGRPSLPQDTITGQKPLTHSVGTFQPPVSYSPEAVGQRLPQMYKTDQRAFVPSRPGPTTLTIQPTPSQTFVPHYVTPTTTVSRFGTDGQTKTATQKDYVLPYGYPGAEGLPSNASTSVISTYGKDIPVTYPRVAPEYIQQPTTDQQRPISRFDTIGQTRTATQKDYVLPYGYPRADGLPSNASTSVISTYGKDIPVTYPRVAPEYIQQPTSDQQRPISSALPSTIYTQRGEQVVPQQIKETATAPSISQVHPQRQISIPIAGQPQTTITFGAQQGFGLQIGIGGTPYGGTQPSISTSTPSDSQTTLRIPHIIQQPGFEVRIHPSIEQDQPGVGLRQQGPQQEIKTQPGAPQKAVLQYGLQPSQQGIQPGVSTVERPGLHYGVGPIPPSSQEISAQPGVAQEPRIQYGVAPSLRVPDGVKAQPGVYTLQPSYGIAPGLLQTPEGERYIPQTPGLQYAVSPEQSKLIHEVRQQQPVVTEPQRHDLQYFTPQSLSGIPQGRTTQPAPQVSPLQYGLTPGQPGVQGTRIQPDISGTQVPGLQFPVAPSLPQQREVPGLDKQHGITRDQQEAFQQPTWQQKIQPIQTGDFQSASQPTIGFQPGVSAQPYGWPDTYKKSQDDMTIGTAIGQQPMGPYGTAHRERPSFYVEPMKPSYEQRPVDTTQLEPGFGVSSYDQSRDRQPSAIYTVPQPSKPSPTQQQVMPSYSISTHQPGGIPSGSPYPPSSLSYAPKDSALVTSLTGAGTDDAFSQAQTSISNGQASANAEGKKHGGSAKTQVQGTYSSTGSFTASAMTSDNDRSASSQVSGNSEGAMSQAQGQGGAAQSQAQVQVNEKTGGTKSSSQSGGLLHQSQSEVQANDKGGLADAQSSGPGQTSSQAQIGFRPGQDGNVVQSVGGGQASAQSGALSGQSQSQIQGTSKFGVSYHGAAQSASGTKEQVASYREQNRNLFNAISQFSGADAVTDHVDTVYNPTYPGLTSEETDRIPDLQLKSSKASSTNKLNNEDDNVPYDEDDEEPYDEYEDEDYYNDSFIKINSKSISNTKTAKSNINDKNAFPQIDSSKLESKLQKPYIRNHNSNNTEDSDIPSGFRGTINIEKKFHTKSLEPHNTNTNSTTLSSTSSGVSSKNQMGENLLPSKKPLPPDSYVTVTKSITGSMSNPKNPTQDNNKFQSTFYTKSSTCGYFTFSCNIVYGANGRSKICRPKAPTNGKC